MRRNTRRIAPLTFIAAGLLRMAAVSCMLLALWRLTSDLGWTGAFFLEEGLFSHWQVWLALTFALSMLSFRLARYSRPSEAVTTIQTLPEPLPEKAEAVQPSPKKAELARRA